MGWSDKAQPDPQWLKVDLGSAQTLSGVADSWWKPYARSCTGQEPDDLEGWVGVAAIKGKRNLFGDLDVIRYKPGRTRYVRLHCTERAVDWQAYTVFDLAVFHTLPECPGAKRAEP